MEIVDFIQTLTQTNLFTEISDLVLKLSVATAIGTLSNTILVFFGENFLSSKHIYEAIKILKKRDYKLINLGGPVNNQPGVERFKESISTEKKKIFSYYLNIKN